MDETKSLPRSNTTVTQEQNEMLIKSITTDEVIAMVNEMQPNKTLGLDGIQVLFFQNSWPIIYKEVLDTIVFVLNQGIMPVSWKRIFITLIPEKINPFIVNDYRPISLCNTIYKIITKILVNRLQPLLYSLVFIE